MKATKIVRLQAENVKRLRAVAIEPDGSVVQISGRNAQGKSSVLDAIWMALGGKRAMPRRPVRDGADEATIRLELEELIVERRIKPDGQTSLVVSSPEGARYPSPQAMLDALVGSLSFDPLAFSRLDPKRQREVLRELVGLDTSAIDAERARLFETRTGVTREVRRLEGEISGVPHHPDAPAVEVSVADLTGELQRAEEHQRDIERARSDASVRAAELRTAEELAASLRAQIADLERQLEAARARLQQGESTAIPARRAALDEAMKRAQDIEATAPDRDAIAAQLAGAEQVNAQVRGNARREQLKAKHREVREEAERLTRAITECDTKKAEMIAGAAYPLAGLGVDDHGVTLDGLPFEQASSAEQLRASVAIGLALQPTLRVLLVRDGSLLDADSMRLLAELATEADAQVWVETVSDGAGAGIVIEDGAVRVAAEAAE